MSDIVTENDYFKDGLCMHCQWAREVLQDFRYFHTETEGSWVNKDSQLQNKINEELKKQPLKYQQQIIESYSFDLHQFQNQFPNIHRESLIITIYNFLEKQLNTLCKILSKYFENSVKLNELNGKGVRRAFLYLSKIANLDSTKFKNEKEYIINVNRLRNQIVHNGGDLPQNSNDPLNVFIENNKYLYGSPNEQVSLDADFIYELVDTLTSFFEKLDCEIQMFITKINS